MIAAFLLFALYAILEGVRDAVVFSEYYRKWNEHVLLFASRGIVAIGFAFAYGLEGALLLVAFMFAFPFFQLSAYYTTYQKLGHPYYNFFSKSSTTDAKMNFNFEYRVVMLVLSICILIYLVC